jgi:adenine-specific DNA-methyltransferase
MFKTIRYIGAKTKLKNDILQLLSDKGVRPGLVLDPFAGSARVSWALRQAGHQVIASDSLRLSAALQTLALGFQRQPDFVRLLPALGFTATDFAGCPATAVLQHLMTLPPRTSFVTREYSPSAPSNGRDRKYFTVANANRIDTVRHAIREYAAQDLICDREHDYLLGILLVAASRSANTQGHMDAFLAEFQPSSLRPIQLRLPVHLPTQLPFGIARQGDAAQVAASTAGLELAYFDPPYNERRYDTYYHVLERIACGWWAGNIECVGRTGKPALREERSPWCGRDSAEAALMELLCAVDSRHLLMSYSSEGVLRPDLIEEALRQRGRADTFDCRAVGHRRYRGSRTRGGGDVSECLYYVRLA